MYKSINTSQLNQLLAEKGELTLLDVRRKADYYSAPQKIPGASWKDPDDVKIWGKTITSTGLILVYCVRGGPVSQAVATQLQGDGVDAVFLEGGLKAWEDDERPVAIAASMGSDVEV